ncbi:hypothetical protein ABPG74_007422 [Tetrahymena malaccensis]
MSLLELFCQVPFQKYKMNYPQKELCQNFSKKQINDEQLKILLSNIKLQNSLTSIQLSLNDNNIGDKGISDLVAWLNTQKNLVNLSLFISFNSFTNNGIKSLSQIKQMKSLEKLTLSVSNNELGYDLAENLGQFISKQVNFKQLIVMANSCDLGNFGAIRICQSISSLTCLEKLEILLDENSMTSYGALGCVKQISQNKQIKHLNLEICNNKIRDLRIQDQIYELKCNVISKQCANDMIECIGTQMPKLETLNLKALYYSDFSVSQFKKEGYEVLANDDDHYSKEEIHNQIETFLHSLQQKNLIY